MNENTVTGAAKSRAGQLETDLGRAFDDPDMVIHGAKRQIEGRTQHLIGKAQERLNTAASSAADSAAKVTARARTAVDQAAKQAQKVDSQVKPFVVEQPYTALAMAAATGLLLGLLIAGRGPKIVYITPRT